MRTVGLISFFVLALAATSPSHAQTKQPSLVPEHFGSWNRDTCTASPALAVPFAETKILDLSTCQYKNGDHSMDVSATKYQDPSAAYENYTAGLHPGMLPSFVANNSAVDQEKLWLLTGNVVLRVESQQLASEADLKQLVKSLEGHADHTPLPPIRSYLPEYGLVSGSQRYALGSDGFQAALGALDRKEFGVLGKELGFEVGAETMLAEYQGGHGNGVLLMIEYPTPQLAEQHWKHLESALTAAGKKSATVIERKGSLLTMALGASSAEFATALRHAVNYETQVTWNEPSQTLTDPPFLSTIAKIFISTGVFMVVALVLGVAFGGLRVVTKRLFPGKVFDRPEDIEVLQMGLSGKKIDPTDMY